MSVKLLSNLPPAASLDGTELIHIEQSGNSRKATTEDVADLISDSQIRSRLYFDQQALNIVGSLNVSSVGDNNTADFTAYHTTHYTSWVDKTAMCDAFDYGNFVYYGSGHDDNSPSATRQFATDDDRVQQTCDYNGQTISGEL